MSSKDIESTPLPYSKPKATLLSNGQRHDGRQAEEFRQLFLQVGPVSRAAGSAYAEFSNTKIMCAVYGPRESERKEPFAEHGQLNCDVKFARSASQIRGALSQMGVEREVTGALEAALTPAVLLHTFPKMCVDVYCLVVEADGGVLPVAITTACLALGHAGIALRDLVSCCTLGRVGRQLLLDPDEEESEKADASLTLAIMPSLDLVTGTVMKGQWTLRQIQEAIEGGKAHCQRLDDELRATLREALLEPMDPG